MTASDRLRELLAARSDAYLPKGRNTKYLSVRLSEVEQSRLDDLAERWGLPAAECLRWLVLLDLFGGDDFD